MKTGKIVMTALGRITGPRPGPEPLGPNGGGGGGDGGRKEGGEGGEGGEKVSFRVDSISQ